MHNVYSKSASNVQTHSFYELNLSGTECIETNVAESSEMQTKTSFNKLGMI